jgi:hypothetical protein
MASADRGLSLVGISLPVLTLVLLLSELGVIFLCLPASWMKQVYVQERQLVERQLGEEVLQSIETTTSGWFKRFVVDTGVLASSYSLAERRGKDPFDDRGLGGWFANRLDVFWVAIRQMLFRFGVVELWLSCALLFIAAAFIDALLQRQILKYETGAASPLMYRIAEWIIAGVFMAIFLSPLLPVTMMSPLAVPVGMGAVAFALWFAVVKSAKRF